MTFDKTQTTQLLQPINPKRVLKDGKNNSHVSQQDVTAHLIRIFGFGNFSTMLIEQELLFEECRDPSKGYRDQRWDVGYRATMRLTIFEDHDGNGDRNIICSFEDSSCGDAQNQVRHDAHDLALKSAISLAKKRCCINLGDQFGLSLYNKGQMTALVKATLVTPPGWKAEDKDEKTADIQEGVEQQQSMGHDEVEKERAETEPTPEQAAALEQSVGTKAPAKTVEEAKAQVEKAVEQREDVPQGEPDPAADLDRNDPPTEEVRVTPTEDATRRREMFALMNEAKIIEGIEDADEQKVARLSYTQSVIGHEVASSTDLTYAEVQQIIAALRTLIDSEKAGTK